MKIPNSGFASGVTPPLKSTPVPPPQAQPLVLPGESFERAPQRDVQEREARPSADPTTEDQLSFPALTEGLTPDYLALGARRGSLAPTTLLATEFESLGLNRSPFGGRSLDPVAPDQVRACPAVAQAWARMPQGSRWGQVLQEETLLREFDQVRGGRSFGPEEEAQLVAFSQLYFSHAYALAVAARCREVIQRFFPALYLELPLNIQLSDSGAGGGYEWVQGVPRITLALGDSLVSVREAQDQVLTAGPFGGDHLYRRGVVDLIFFVHEYAHALFDRFLGVPAETDVQCVSRALSEGFAVLLEILILDELSREPDGDAFYRVDLEKRRRQRVEWLRRVLDPDPAPALQAYAEGTEIMVGVYRQGGVEAVKSFLLGLNPARASALQRSHPDYRAAFPDPAKIGLLVCR